MRRRDVDGGLDRPGHPLMTVTPKVEPGTVLVTRSGGFAAFMIRLGAALRGRPNLGNHVAVAHHTDAKGTLWVIEGKPGGVGWRDATAYLTSTWTLTNVTQPVTDAQRAAICTHMEALLGTAYDWQSIAADALSDLGMTLPGWDAEWNGQVAGQVVCSPPPRTRTARPGCRTRRGTGAASPQLVGVGAAPRLGEPHVTGTRAWLAVHRKLVVAVVGAALTLSIQVWGTDNVWVSFGILAATSPSACTARRTRPHPPLSRQPRRMSPARRRRALRVPVEPCPDGVCDDAADRLAGGPGIVFQPLPLSPEAQAERLLQVPVRHLRPRASGCRG